MLPGYGTDGGPTRYPWPSPLRDGLPGLLDEVSARSAEPGEVVALASGDPLRSGIATTLTELLGPDGVRVHPWLSADTLARARLGWSAEETTVVTLVGRDVGRLRRHLDPGARVVVLCSDGSTPARVAKLLVAEGCGDSMMTALWDLGGPEEGAQGATAGDWRGRRTADLVVVALEVDRAGALTRPALGVAPGMPESTFDTDGQLTKRDARASALARLAPRPGGVLWDLGAGTGTVGLEWVRAADRARVVAVERRPDRADRIRVNAEALGYSGEVTVVEADLTDGLPAGLPDPDAVFVGGGLTAGLAAEVLGRLGPGGRIVTHAVTLGTEALLVDLHARHGGELVRISVETATPLGPHLSWTPARPIVQWTLVLG